MVGLQIYAKRPRALLLVRRGIVASLVLVGQRPCSGFSRIKTAFPTGRPQMGILELDVAGTQPEESGRIGHR
jgi:hypothetical protein